MNINMAGLGEEVLSVVVYRRPNPLPSKLQDRDRYFRLQNQEIITMLLGKKELGSIITGQVVLNSGGL